MDDIRILLGCLSAVLFLAVFVSAAFAEPPPAGTYRAEGKTASGMAYGGQVGIEPDGKGVRLAWVLDGGDSYRGVGLQINNVLGSAYWSEDERFNGPGIVVYRIDGGKLHGTWRAYGGPEGLAGREELSGPASLEGRFEITLGENPGGGSSYHGHVNIKRRGDTFLFHWHAPRNSYVGNGIRIGDVMVVGYAHGRAPGDRCLLHPRRKSGWRLGVWQRCAPGARDLAPSIGRRPGGSGRRLGMSGDRRHAMAAGHEPLGGNRLPHR